MHANAFCPSRGTVFFNVRSMFFSPGLVFSTTNLSTHPIIPLSLPLRFDSCAVLEGFRRIWLFDLETSRLDSFFLWPMHLIGADFLCGGPQTSHSWILLTATHTEESKDGDFCLY